MSADASLLSGCNRNYYFRADTPFQLVPCKMNEGAYPALDTAMGIQTNLWVWRKDSLHMPGYAFSRALTDYKRSFADDTKSLEP